MKPRYSGIAAAPNTEAERRRIDEAARKADAKWAASREAAGRMADAEAHVAANAAGWVAKRSHSCDRSKTKRATRIRTTCQVWTHVSTIGIPGLGAGRSLSDCVYAPTWEKALQLARIRATLRRINRKAR